MMMMVSAVLGGWLLLLKLLPFESSSLKQVGPINDGQPNAPVRIVCVRAGATYLQICWCAAGPIYAAGLLCISPHIERPHDGFEFKYLSAESRWNRLEGCKRNFTYCVVKCQELCNIVYH